MHTGRANVNATTSAYVNTCIKYKRHDASSENATCVSKWVLSQRAVLCAVAFSCASGLNGLLFVPDHDQEI